MGRSELQKLLEQKQLLKEQAFTRHWPGTKKNLPLTVVFAPSSSTASSPTHQAILLQLMESFSVLPGKTVVLSSSLQSETSQISPNSSDVLWLSVKDLSAQQLEKWLEAADIGLIFDENQVTIKKLFEKGTVPIAFTKSPLLENYQPNDETGNSFTFDAFNPWSIFMALVRAHETYRFPYDWHHIVRGMLRVR